ncbi:ABC transporter ATP-binding protein [Parvularcula lutaonensis]|uniref:ABC transporter ATP-binding protein n=1 Tax=Parvularcula lutaonensis TaxID=491923 RepID=A0ABV7MGJ6_9PROT|nr:ATP-binding cassette domain-containing protein [Parvularcula lutaonensis]GGY55591.1 ABC transporter ATP-binding protein [Parvularcula lutaonensis]
MVLSINRVTKEFGDFRAVSDLSFSVDKGEIVGFLGQNGAGKTTTLRMVMDILPVTSGSVELFGSTDLRKGRLRVGFLPEERGLYRKMKAIDIIAYFGRLKGVPGGKAKAKAHELLERFGMTQYANNKIETLSKGNAQKIQLLSVLTHEPEFLILDEPFSGLDPVNQKLLEDLIGDLRDEGATVLFSTHTMEHAERLCDRFVMIKGGEKVFEGTIDEAREAYEQRIILATPDDPSPLQGRAGVTAITPIGRDRYALTVSEGSDMQAVLAACLELGITVKSFGLEEASLHEIFFRFAGAGEEDAA